MDAEAEAESGKRKGGIRVANDRKNFENMHSYLERAGGGYSIGYSIGPVSKEFKEKLEGMVGKGGADSIIGSAIGGTLGFRIRKANALIAAFVMGWRYVQKDHQGGVWSSVEGNVGEGFWQCAREAGTDRDELGEHTETPADSVSMKEIGRLYGEIREVDWNPADGREQGWEANGTGLVSRQSVSLLKRLHELGWVVELANSHSYVGTGSEVGGGASGAQDSGSAWTVRTRPPVGRKSEWGIQGEDRVPTSDEELKWSRCWLSGFSIMSQGAGGWQEALVLSVGAWLERRYEILAKSENLINGLTGGSVSSADNRSIAKSESLIEDFVGREEARRIAGRYDDLTIEPGIPVTDEPKEE